MYFFFKTTKVQKVKILENLQGKNGLGLSCQIPCCISSVPLSIYHQTMYLFHRFSICPRWLCY